MCCHYSGHILGIGSLWEPLGIAGSDEDNCPYFGANANREFQAISGCDAAPTETDGETGDGTFCGHWSEACMQNEFMTGFLSASNPVSRVTIGSLQDIGFEVDYSVADEYGSSNLGICSCQNNNRNLRFNAKPKRKLSQEMHDYATECGRDMLKKNAAKHAEMDDTPDAVYFGDKMMFVYVEDEEGEVVGVPVFPE